MKITDCQPGSGNPTVREERGAYGNVSYGGTRNLLHIPKGCRTETLCLRLRAPYFYPTSGACLHRGDSGTWESQGSPWGQIRRRSAAQRGKDSRRGKEAPAFHTSLGRPRDTKQEARPKGSGKERENRTTPRWAIGSL